MSDLRALYQSLIMDHGKNPRNKRPMDEHGRYTSEVSDWSGTHVFDANPHVTLSRLHPLRTFLVKAPKGMLEFGGGSLRDWYAVSGRFR